MNTFDKKLLGQVKKLLLAEKKRLEGLLLRVAKKGAKEGDYRATYPEYGSKDDENAAEVTQYETNIAEEFDLAQKLQRVEAALKRMKEGKYGVCEVCGEEIPKARLEAVPEASTCVKHAR